MEKIIIYQDDFIPQPGWKIYQKNTKIDKFDLGVIGEYWQKCRTTEICNLYNSGDDHQVPFNLTVLFQLLRENLIPDDWKTYLRNSLPATKGHSWTDIQPSSIWSLYDTGPGIHDGEVQDIRKSMPYPVINQRMTDDSCESIAFIGTVYLNHNANPCVPALYMKANGQLDIRYICPNEILKNNSSALAHVHGLRDSDNNLPSTIAYGMINLP